MNKVPFLNLSAATSELECDIHSAIDRVLKSGCYILGPEVESFEKDWASYCDSDIALELGMGWIPWYWGCVLLMWVLVMRS